MRHLSAFALGVLLGMAGCTGIGSKPGKPGPVTQPVPDIRQTLLAHAEGTWETSGRDGKTRQAIFAPGGRLTFKNGLESYNPATWTIKEGSTELDIVFSGVSLEAMQIFQLYVGQGVKSFAPHERKVTYAFTPNTWTLNIAGWDYTKPDTAALEAPPPEPVFR